MTTDTINGFTFSHIGALIGTPEKVDMNLLTRTHDALIKDKEYIRAARINHLIQVELNNQDEYCAHLERNHQ